MRARWCLLAALAASLAACGGGSSATDPTAIGKEVSIDAPAAPGTSEMVRLAGIERGRGTVGVVLAHMLGSQQAAWSPIVGQLVDEGFHVLTFDFRGHGLSSGDRDPSKAGLDLAAAVAKLRSLGATKVAVVGASMGGTAALVVASTDDLAGVATLSAPLRVDALDATEAVRSVKEPLLLIVGARDDRRYTDDARAVVAAAPAAAERLEVISGTSAHGTNLLVETRVASRVAKLLKDFLISRRG